MAVEDLNLEQLNEVVASGELCLIDFWADWCGPCKSIAPLLDSLSDKYEGAIKVAKVNVARVQEAGVKHSITNIPCLIVFKDGKELDRMVGFKGKEGLEGLFSKHTKGS
jgi:thioredoxin 1